MDSLLKKRANDKGRRNGAARLDFDLLLIKMSVTAGTQDSPTSLILSCQLQITKCMAPKPTVPRDYRGEVNIWLQRGCKSDRKMMLMALTKGKEFFKLRLISLL